MRLGNFLLLASVLIAIGWIVLAVEWLGAGLEDWQRVFVVAGVIVLIGLALRSHSTASTIQPIAIKTLAILSCWRRGLISFA
jgi:hypothetical protein